MVKRYLGLALLSASVLALQVTFTRVFSINIWYHFTYLIVGVALLGSGAAGTFLAIKQWSKAKLASQIGKQAVAFSLSILVGLLLITVVEVDPLRRANFQTTIVGLALYFISLFVTFFLGGLTVASIFSIWSERSHKLYFADLLGASIGTLAIVGVVQFLGGPGAMAFLALAVLAAGLLLGDQLSIRWKTGMAVGILLQALLIVYVSFINPIQLSVPESKELGWAMRQYGNPEYTRWNPVGRVDVLPLIEVSEPMIVGGVSSTYLDAQRQSENPITYPLHMVTFDGTSMSGMYQFDGDMEKFRFLEHAVIAAPYLVSPEQPKTLNIGVGGGLDILLARLYNASHITAIDINADVINLLKEPYADFTGNLNDDPNITIEVAEGRGFLMRGDERYDVIQGIGLDNLAALSGGAYVLSESYIYTLEALELALDRLTPEGVFSWTRGTNEPPREMLRLTAIGAEALRRQGVDNPEAHLVIVANEEQNIATLLVSASPFTEVQMNNLRDWSSVNRFNILYDPLQSLDTIYTEYLTSPDPRQFEASYPYNIYPVTDDNPFFYNYFKWTSFSTGVEAAADTNPDAIEYRFPISNLIVLVMLVLSLLAAVVFIIIPLVRYKRSGLQTPYALPMLGYFSLLGLGYIFVEIVLIQRFTLFIGYPTTAISTTIFSMLFFSALGSLVAQRICTTPRRLQIVLMLIVVLTFVYIAVLPMLFNALLQTADFVRVALSVVMIAPLAFLMGMPFPTGLKQISVKSEGMIPWAWGLNGVFSVMGSILVIFVSMTFSFTVALIVAAVFYGAAALVSFAIWRVRVLNTVSDVPALSSTPASVKF